MKRIRAGQYVSVENEDYAQLIGETEARIARECTAKLEQPMEVVFPEEEIRYLAIHLAGKESNQNLVIDSEMCIRDRLCPETGSVRLSPSF